MIFIEFGVYVVWCWYSVSELVSVSSIVLYVCLSYSVFVCFNSCIVCVLSSV